MNGSNCHHPSPSNEFKRISSEKSLNTESIHWQTSCKRDWDFQSTNENSTCRPQWMHRISNQRWFTLMSMLYLCSVQCISIRDPINIAVHDLAGSGFIQYIIFHSNLFIWIVCCCGGGVGGGVTYPDQLSILFWFFRSISIFIIYVDMCERFIPFDACVANENK